MDTQLYDQISNLLEKSQNILILTHARADCDGLGAALAAYSVLKEMGKDVTVATNDPAQENLQFLPAIEILQNSIAGGSDFVITLDAGTTPIGKIKYNVEDHKVNIIITPKSGMFSESDVSFAQGKAKFDLIFVFDTGNLEHLGAIYERNVEMFYETPVINMDHHSSNTDFGQVNAVNPTASSTTEILYEYLTYLEGKMNKKFITEDVATLLLAGIITDTGSFQHANTSPRSMETASKLLDLGGRQQEIIKNIYKTKKLSTLKLWGIILSKVQVDPVYRIVWSSISGEELQEAGADPAETEGVIDDLLTNAPGAEVIFLIKQNDEYVSVSMRSTGSAIDVGAFSAGLGGGGHARAAGFKIKSGRPFDEIVNDVLKKVRAYQAERLNIHPEENKPMGKPAGGERREMRKPEPVRRPETSANKAPMPAPIKQPENRKDQKREEKSMDKPKTTYLDFEAPKAPENDEAKEEIQPVVQVVKPTVEPVMDKPASSPEDMPTQSVKPTIGGDEPGNRPAKRRRPRRRRPRPNKEMNIEPV